MAIPDTPPSPGRPPCLPECLPPLQDSAAFRVWTTQSDLCVLGVFLNVSLVSLVAAVTLHDPLAGDLPWWTLHLGVQQARLGVHRYFESLVVVWGPSLLSSPAVDIVTSGLL